MYPIDHVTNSIIILFASFDRLCQKPYRDDETNIYELEKKFGIYNVFLLSNIREITYLICK